METAVLVLVAVDSIKEVLVLAVVPHPVEASIKAVVQAVSVQDHLVVLAVLVIQDQLRCAQADHPSELVVLAEEVVSLQENHSSTEIEMVALMKTRKTATLFPKCPRSSTRKRIRRFRTAKANSHFRTQASTRRKSVHISWILTAQKVKSACMPTVKKNSVKHPIWRRPSYVKCLQRVNAILETHVPSHMVKANWDQRTRSLKLRFVLDSRREAVRMAIIVDMHMVN